MTDEKLQDMSDGLLKQKEGLTPEIPDSQLPFDKGGSLPKKCIIENSQFSYLLHIDGRVISFQGGSDADFLEKLLTGFGYSVRRTKAYGSH